MRPYRLYAPPTLCRRQPASGTIQAVRGFLGGATGGLFRVRSQEHAGPLRGQRERILPVRMSIVTAALLAALGGTLALPASAAPLAPGAAAADGLITTVQMDRMERHMMRRRMERRMDRRMMRHRMERREMRHHMMRRDMMHRM